MDDFINFSMRYKGLSMSAEMDVAEGAKQDKVVKHLEVIDSWIYDNIYSVLGIDTKLLSEFAKGFGPKEVDPFPHIVEFVSSSAAKDKIAKACKGDKKIEGLARTCLIGILVKKQGLI